MSCVGGLTKEQKRRRIEGLIKNNKNNKKLELLLLFKIKKRGWEGQLGRRGGVLLIIWWVTAGGPV